MDNVTFMVTYGCGTNLANCYSMVNASSYNDGMDYIFKVTDGKFAFTYIDAKSIASQIEMYGLKEVALQPQVKI